MRELCAGDRRTCEIMYQQQNALRPPGQCMVDNWLECVVYELGAFAVDGYEGHKCAVNRSLLRRLRKKFDISDYGIENLTLEDKLLNDPHLPPLDIWWR